MHNIIVHILDKTLFYEGMKKKGYSSISELAKALGLHRNTIHYYLSGNGVFPDCLDKILAELDLNPAEVLIQKQFKKVDLEEIAPVIDQLAEEFPEITFILFGSRAKTNAAKYSDWDIGVFSKQGLDHELYRRMIRRKDELVENLPFFVDLVNFNRADDDFLLEVSKNWKFLVGKIGDWIFLQKKVAL
ncbi:MAG: nucleotidyltransferase domain-containing protein [Pseudomonadota bacterium]